MSKITKLTNKLAIGIMRGIHFPATRASNTGLKIYSVTPEDFRFPEPAAYLTHNPPRFGCIVLDIGKVTYLLVIGNGKNTGDCGPQEIGLSVMTANLECFLREIDMRQYAGIVKLKETPLSKLMGYLETSLSHLYTDRVYLEVMDVVFEMIIEARCSTTDTIQADSGAQTSDNEILTGVNRIKHGLEDTRSKVNIQRTKGTLVKEFSLRRVPDDWNIQEFPITATVPDNLLEYKKIIVEHRKKIKSYGFPLSLENKLLLQMSSARFFQCTYTTVQVVLPELVYTPRDKYQLSGRMPFTRTI